MSAYGAAFERLGGFVAAIAGAGAGVGVAGRGDAATGAILGGMVGVPNSRRTSAAGSIVLMGATDQAALRVLRSPPTCQPVILSEGRTGFGMRPSALILHTVGTEHPNNPATTLSRTIAESGRESKLRRASGIDADTGFEGFM